MLKDYKTRVRGVQEMLRQCLQLISREHDSLRRVVREADAYAASAEFRQQPLTLQFEATSDSMMIDFLGVEFEEVQSEITGGSWFRSPVSGVAARRASCQSKTCTSTSPMSPSLLINRWQPCSRRASRLAQQPSAMRKLSPGPPSAGGMITQPIRISHNSQKPASAPVFVVAISSPEPTISRDNQPRPQTAQDTSKGCWR